MRVIRITTLVSTAVLAAACGSSGGAKATTTSTAVTASASSVSPPSPGGVRVDLTISGGSSARIKGTKGSCRLSKTIGNSYDFEGADYPDLGSGALSLSIGARLGDRVLPPNIKLVVKDAGYLTGSDVSGIHVNPEGTVVNLDQTVSGSTSGGPLQTVRITGTINCT